MSGMAQGIIYGHLPTYGSVPVVAFEMIQMGKLSLIGVNLSEVTQLVRGREEVQSQICAISALRLLPPHRACSFEE